MNTFYAMLLLTQPAAIAGLQSLYTSSPPKPGMVTSTQNYAPWKQAMEQAMGSAPATSDAAAAAAPANTSPELLSLWSQQVSVELGASQLYLSASIWMNARNYKGMAAFMLEESGEERGHGLAILDFAKKRGFPVTLEPLVAPPADWRSPVEVWEDILLAEQTNTQNLLRLAATADACGDYGAMAFLDPFHIEQIDAEEKVGGVLARVREASPALMMEIDFALGKEAEEEDHH